MGKMQEIRISEIPEAEAARVSWLMCSGASSKAEAMDLARRFVADVQRAKSQLDKIPPITSS